LLGLAAFSSKVTRPPAVEAWKVAGWKLLWWPDGNLLLWWSRGMVELLPLLELPWLELWASAPIPSMKGTSIKRPQLCIYICYI
jgi:hypothetical protein